MFMKKLQRVFAKDDDASTGGADVEEEVEEEETEAEPEEDADEAEGEGDESEGEEEADAGEDSGTSTSAAAAEGSTGRKENRVAALAKRAKEAEERAIRAETLAEERATAGNRNAGLSQEEQRRVRDEKLALMDPQEKRDFLRDEQMQNMQQQVLLTQLQTKDALDRAAYQTRAVSDPVWARHSAEVERRLAQARQGGIDYPRQTILAQVIGEAALNSKPKAGAKKAANERLTASAAKPVQGRSNAAANQKGGRKGESLEDLERRLENQVF